RTLQRRFGRTDVLLQRLLRRPRGRHRGRLIHLPPRSDTPQSSGERRPALARGPREGAGAPRGHARYVLREHADHDPRLRIPRSRLRPQLVRENPTGPTRGRRLGIALRLSQGETVTSSEFRLRFGDGGVWRLA